MTAKKILALVLALTMVLAFSACGKDKKNNSTAQTVTGGSVEDVFGLSSNVDGEEPTIDAGMVDADSGKVTGSSSKKTTAKPSIKDEKVVSDTIESKATDDGVTFSWAAISGASTYDVYRSSSKDGEYTYIGSTTKTSYTDKTAKKGQDYFYKVTVPKQSSTTTAAVTASSGFKGNSITFENTKGGSTIISSRLNNTYVAFIRNEYAKKGITCPAGRLAYVQIPTDKGGVATYVFQFDNAKTWNGSTLEQVHMFTDDESKSYYSFFTKNPGDAGASDDYLAAKEDAVKKWESTQEKSSGKKYATQQEELKKLAEDAHFQEVINGSY